jgi:chemotaxis protein methyltransferase CheR
MSSSPYGAGTPHGDQPSGLIARLRAVIAKRLGFRIEDGKLEGLLAQRAARRDESPAEYVNALEVAGAGAPEILALVAELTVPETYFFRHAEQFRAFLDHALPDRLQVQVTSRRIRVLSAGCASGEEPYTLAMLVRERASASEWELAIRAFDVNPAVLERARRAAYTSWSLRETPPAARRRWFHPVNGEFVVDAAITREVTFEIGNLAEPEALDLPDGAFDVIFCRNVLMYFTPEVARAAVARLHRALAPDGYLFLGHAETLRGISHDFHLRHTHDAFYYQRKPGGSNAPEHDVWSALPTVPEPERWLDAIRDATARIQDLVRAPEQPRAPAIPAPPERFDVDAVLELVAGERFEEALGLIRSVPTRLRGDREVILLEAVLLAQRGELALAEARCAELLAEDELNAAAHYVLALCHEGENDRPSAIEHYQTSAYLDPTFALPHLHHGRLARGAGDRATARRELGQALVLLQREEAPRLLLFGGGFKREALLALCRAELLACGGAP